MNPHAKSFCPSVSCCFVNPLTLGSADECLTLSSSSGTDIMHMNQDTLTMIIRRLSPEDIANVAISSKEMNEMTKGYPKISALAEYYRTKDERRYGTPTHLISALFAVSQYVHDAHVADEIMAELVKGARLTESDGPVLVKAMTPCSDESTTRVIGVLRRLPGFTLCMKSARSENYTSPLVCVCSEARPRSTEAMLDIPETDVNVIVSNGIVCAPLLHWLLVKWDIDELKRDAAKKRIVRSILERPDQDLHRPWKMAGLGTRKAMELVWERDLPEDKDDLEAKADLLRVLSW